MKKLLLIVIVITLALSFTACETKKNEKTVQDSSKKVKVVNDAMYNVSEKEMVKKTGINFANMQGADKVTYNVLEASSDKPIAELEFCMDGWEAYVRAVPTSLLPIAKDTDKEVFKDYDISGLFYEWDIQEKTTVNECDAYTFISTKEKTGYIMWLDAAPGILYNLGMKENADAKELINLAKKVFKPMQGEN